MNYETPNGNTPPDTNLPLYPEDTLLPCPDNKIATSGFLQVVPPGSAAPLPLQPVPEEFPLTVAEAPSPPPCEILQTIDLGVLPWSKQPIREITPLVWFRYEKEELPVPGPETFTIYNVIDGNGRTLFCVNEEGMANFFCNAANIYVHASLTQV